MVKSFAQQWGLNAGIALTCLLLIANLAKEWGGFGRDSEQQRELVTAVALLKEGLQAEQAARELLAVTLKTLAERGDERSARRSSEVATLAGRLSAVEGKVAGLQIDLAGKLAEISADVRAIKDRLGNRAAVAVPQREG